MLLTTHYMDEAQVLADRVAVIANGVIVASGTPGLDRRARHGDSDDPFCSSRGARPGWPRSASATATEGAVTVVDGRRLVQIATDSPTSVLYRLTSWAVERGVELDGLEVARPSLEDVYISLTAEENSQ